ncbi:PhoH family protein [Planctomycetaceae bacterium SH139]
MTLEVSPPSDILTLFGPRDQHLRALRVYYDVAITQRDGRVRISGEHNNVRLATRAMKALRGIVQRQGILTADDVERVLAEQRMTGEAGGLVGSKGATHVEPAALPPIDLHQAGRRVKPRTAGQAVYVEAIRKQDLTFCAGPAGSGKTYLAVACAVEAFKEQRVRKIVLVRPAVEAGENLGFLPGDLRAKLNPYLRPLLDAINEMVDYDQARELMEREIVEVVPLAYMRGRTLNDAFIILDEAQNTTVPQMKMFLTRMGERSRMVVSGDTSQVDLPRGVQSGLRDAMMRLGNIAEIGMIRLQKTDIVRHALVQQIVRAYEEQDS